MPHRHLGEHSGPAPFTQPPCQHRGFRFLGFVTSCQDRCRLQVQVHVVHAGTYFVQGFRKEHRVERGHTAFLMQPRSLEAATGADNSSHVMPFIWPLQASLLFGC